MISGVSNLSSIDNRLKSSVKKIVECSGERHWSYLVERSPPGGEIPVCHLEEGETDSLPCYGQRFFRGWTFCTTRELSEVVRCLAEKLESLWRILGRYARGCIGRTT